MNASEFEKLFKSHKYGICVRLASLLARWRFLFNRYLSLKLLTRKRGHDLVTDSWFLSHIPRDCDYCSVCNPLIALTMRDPDFQMSATLVGCCNSRGFASGYLCSGLGYAENDALFMVDEVLFADGLRD